MALIICPECEKEISDKADFCPQCGCPKLNSQPCLSVSELNLPETDITKPTYCINTNARNKAETDENQTSTLGYNYLKTKLMYLMMFVIPILLCLGYMYAVRKNNANDALIQTTEDLDQAKRILSKSDVSYDELLKAKTLIPSISSSVNSPEGCSEAINLSIIVNKKIEEMEAARKEAADKARKENEARSGESNSLDDLQRTLTANGQRWITSYKVEGASAYLKINFNLWNRLSTSQQRQICDLFATKNWKRIGLVNVWLSVGNTKVGRIKPVLSGGYEFSPSGL
jgi:hypothetical protein